jgi:coenzyme Q-binding protein COQ10
MMRTIDRITIEAPIDRVFGAVVQVERWPAILSHYRWVRFLEHGDGVVCGDERGGAEESVRLVEMAAWRPFGPLRFPTWWVSEMTVARKTRTIRYRHVRGITRGMDVAWRIEPAAGAGERGVDVTIVHEWVGPRWPLIGRLAAERVIGPVFIHGIASRTLAGIKRYAERAT